MSKTIYRSACAILAVVLASVPAPAFQDQTSKSSDTFLNGAPFTFDQLLRIVREKAIPPRRQKEAIQNRGVDFIITPENIQSLESAGAAQDLLDLVIRRAKRAPA